MAALNGSLDAGDEHHAALARVRVQRPHIDLSVVQSDRESVVSQRGRSIDELIGRVRNAVDRIV